MGGNKCRQEGEEDEQRENAGKGGENRAHFNRGETKPHRQVCHQTRGEIQKTGPRRKRGLGWLLGLFLQYFQSAHTCMASLFLPRVLPLWEEATWAKYWITFFVFSVFPAPDSPLEYTVRDTNKKNTDSLLNRTDTKYKHACRCCSGY